MLLSTDGTIDFVFTDNCDISDPPGAYVSCGMGNFPSARPFLGNHLSFKSVNTNSVYTELSALVSFRQYLNSKVTCTLICIF
jgi:hypothetical protein